MPLRDTAWLKLKNVPSEVKLLNENRTIGICFAEEITALVKIAS